MPADWQQQAIEAAARTIQENATLLTELDSAIGDGDHGNNMKRGFAAVAEKAEELAALPTGQGLQKLGMTLVSTVGGASGPLYGSLFMAMGKSLGDRPLDPENLVEALAEGIAAVEKRGKSQPGEKTMLDVLVPVLEELKAAVSGGETAPGALAKKARAAAEAGLENTREMEATKGRAAYLGPRSVGHLDPGAQSSCLLVAAICEVCKEVA